MSNYGYQAGQYGGGVIWEQPDPADTSTHVQPARSEEGSGAALIYAVIILLALVYGVACLFEPYLILLPVGGVALYLVWRFGA